MIIRLDHPITVAASSLHEINIRPATIDDVEAAKRELSSMSRTAQKAFVRDMASRLQPGSSLGGELFFLIILRRMTGLPLATLLQVDEKVQAQFREHLSAISNL